MKMRTQPTLAIAALAATFVVGCQPASMQASTSAPAPTTQRPAGAAGAGGAGASYTPRAEAGVPVTQSGDTARWDQLVVNRANSFGRRSDPFGLNSSERAFDAAQSAERIAATTGGWMTAFTYRDEVSSVPVPVFEPQPYRRLSGVVVGDQVLAIIEMENGAVHLVRPGQMVPNSPWRVVSIDGDRAVLRRAGTTLPRQIEVRLETPPAGFGPAPTAPPAGPGGMPPGFQGGPPPGFGGPGRPPGGGGGRSAGDDF